MKFPPITTARPEYVFFVPLRTSLPPSFLPLPKSSFISPFLPSLPPTATPPPLSRLLSRFPTEPCEIFPSPCHTRARARARTRTGGPMSEKRFSNQSRSRVISPPRPRRKNGGTALECSSARLERRIPDSKVFRTSPTRRAGGPLSTSF